MIRFSCGCESHSFDDGQDVMYKEYDDHGRNAICYALICKKCVGKYEILHTDEEAKEWLLNGTT
jgi:hypothetical protein